MVGLSLDRIYTVPQASEQYLLELFQFGAILTQAFSAMKKTSPLNAAEKSIHRTIIMSQRVPYERFWSFFLQLRYLRQHANFSMSLPSGSIYDAIELSLSLDPSQCQFTIGYDR